MCLKDNNIFITGHTNSTDFPTTPSAYDESHNGNNDIFVTKFKITPKAVTNLDINIQGQGYALSWDTSSTIGATYNIYRSTTSNTFSTALATSLSVATYLDTIIDQNETYYYVVTANADGNEGDYSNEVCTDNISRDTLELSISMVDSRTLYVGEEFELTYSVTDQNESAVQGADIIVYEGYYPGETWVIADTLISDVSGEATYIGQIPRDVDSAQVTCAGRAKLWPYIISTVANINLNINLNTEVWDIGFRPEDNGYSFSNGLGPSYLWPSTWQDSICDAQPYDDQAFIGLYDLTGNQLSLDCEYFPDWELWVDVFGEDQCYSGGTYDADAVAEWSENYQEYVAACYGFATTSLLYYSNLLSLPDGCNNAYDVSLDNASRYLLNKYSVYQWGQEQHSNQSSTMEYTPNRTVDSLIASFERDDDYYRCTSLLWPTEGGHTVTPYKIVRTSSIDTIYVYNPDAPASIVQIFVDRSANEWSYPSDSISGQTSNFYPELEIIDFTSAPTIASAIIGGSVTINKRPHLGPDKNSTRFYFNRDAEITIASSDNYEINNRNNANNNFGKSIRSMLEMDNAIIGFDVKNQIDNRFEIAVKPNDNSENHLKCLTGDDFMISLNYQTEEKVDKQLFDIDLLNRSISISATHDNALLNISLVKTMSNHERIWRINNSSLNAGDILTMNMEQDGQDLIINNNGQNKSYDLFLLRNSSDFGKFKYPELQITKSDIHILRVTNWQNFQDSILLIKYANFDMSEPYSVECLNCSATDVRDQGSIDMFNIMITPHPVKGTANIQYYVPEADIISIELYNSIGKIVTIITNKYHAVGNYNIEYNCSSLSSGVYLYKITSSNYSSSGKMIINK